MDSREEKVYNYKGVIHACFANKGNNYEADVDYKDTIDTHGVPDDAYAVDILEIHCEGKAVSPQEACKT